MVKHRSRVCFRSKSNALSPQNRYPTAKPPRALRRVFFLYPHPCTIMTKFTGFHSSLLHAVPWVSSLAIVTLAMACENPWPTPAPNPSPSHAQNTAHNPTQNPSPQPPSPTGSRASSKKTPKKSVTMAFPRKTRTKPSSPPSQTPPISQTLSKAPPKSSPNQAKAPAQGLSVQHLLREEDIRDALGTNLPLKAVALQGIPASDTYNSTHFMPEKGKGTFGVAVQLWREGSPQNRKRMALHRKSYKGAREATTPVPGAIMAKQGQIHHLGWISADQRDVVTLTCHQSICDTTTLMRLGRKVEARRRTLAP